MGVYDQALAKSLSGQGGKDLERVVFGDLEKAHVKAHFRLNPKTGKREFIKDYDDARHKDEVHVSFHKGHKVKVNNPKSKHHGKTMEVTGYSDKYDVVRGKIDGEKHAVDFHADHLEHHDGKGDAKATGLKADDPDKMKAELSKLQAAVKSSDIRPGTENYVFDRIRVLKQKLGADQGVAVYKKGDKVSILTPRKYDALAPVGPVDGVIVFMDSKANKYTVQVGTGAYTVDGKDLKLVTKKKNTEVNRASKPDAGKSQFKLGDTVETPSGMKRQVIKGVIERATGREKVLVHEPGGPKWYEADRVKKVDGAD